MEDSTMFGGWFDISKRSKQPHVSQITATQMDWEIKELIKIYKAFSPKRVLEIGSEKGGTLWYWLTLAQEGASIVNIDLLQNQSAEEALLLPERWKSWTPQGVEYHAVIGRSDNPVVYNTVMEYLNWQIDFLFIDGLHSYEGSKYDFMTYGKHVTPGGVIVFHDLFTPEAQPWIQVSKLWDEIQMAGYKTQELTCGIPKYGIGVVYL